MTDEITNDAVDIATSTTPETGDTKPKRKGRPSKSEQSEQLDGKATSTETPNEQAVNEPVEATTTEPEQATQSSTPSAKPEQAEKHRGRSTIDENGEKRSEKLMLYLTPSLIDDIRDWCRLKGISCVDYITNTVKADLETKLSKIKAYRELRDNA